MKFRDPGKRSLLKQLTAVVILSCILQISCGGEQHDTETVSLKNECMETMFVLVDKLIDLQISNASDPDFGAITCPHCNVLHTRASEAVYPFAVAYKVTGEEKYLRAAVNTGNWLIRQQQPGGEWIETPWDWTGTTADQLLMMSLAYPIIEKELSPEAQQDWKRSIIASAEFLVEKMSPDFASINYCGTTPATLLMTNRVIPNQRYVDKARELARWTVAKMDEDGFIDGEAARMLGVKYGADIGYEMDMSFWGLELYARESGDSYVHDLISNALATHLNFVYPNGGIDGSWGARCYKWTTFGSKTADGPQILFSLFAPENPQYRTAAIRNLRYLRTMIQGDMIGYGPHYFKLFDKPPCNYSTFARAKNLALAAELGEQEPGTTPPLPADQPRWLRFYPTVDVAVVRTNEIMTTVSAYRYKDVPDWGAGKYTHRPTGGAQTNLWIKDFGLFQTSSQTQYVRGEPMHMPVLDDTVICLTPRIEYRDELGYFTNLYEANGKMATQQHGPDFTVRTSGELCNSAYVPGGVAYILKHEIGDNYIQKSVHLRYHDRLPDIRIIEPVVQHAGMEFLQVDKRTVQITGGKRNFEFKLLSGEAKLIIGEQEKNYWYPFPSLKCYPIELRISAPEERGITEISYLITVL